jgi:hypothetical protein
MPTVTFRKVEVAQKENWDSFGLLFTKAIFLHFLLKRNFKAWFVVGILKVQKLLGLATNLATLHSYWALFSNLLVTLYKKSFPIH